LQNPLDVLPVKRLRLSQRHKQLESLSGVMAIPIQFGN